MGEVDTFDAGELEPDERVRVWLLNAGPSENSAFHVIGSIFDTDGSYPFVTHEFANVPKGAVGVLLVGEVDADASH